MKMTNNVRVQFNKVFKAANKCKKRYKLLKGSAGSGKSVNVAQDYIIKLGDPYYKGANLLVVRKVNATNQDSTFAELVAAIHRVYGSDYQKYWKITTKPLYIENLETGNAIIFRGLNNVDEKEKVKSINFQNGKLTWIWVEEATELREEDVEILDDRLRGVLPNPNLFYQITFTFNPVSATHWIKRIYFDIEDNDVFTHQSTYRNNRFIDEAYYKRMERRKKIDPDGYRVYGLGEWGEVGGLILTNFEVKDFDTSRNRFDSFFRGQDFGFNHANAILGIGFKDGDLYITDEIYEFEKDTEEIIQIANRRGYEKKIVMYCDSAEPDRIQMWRKAGYRAMPVKKEKNSVQGQIDFLKQLKIYIHPSCTHTIKEIQGWKWKKDTKTGLYIDEPVEIEDDAMAALRYGIEGIRKGTNEVQATQSIY
jgi:phage terminase large subunit